MKKKSKCRFIIINYPATRIHHQYIRYPSEVEPSRLCAWSREKPGYSELMSNQIIK